jgi:hypothetical protein
MLGLILACLPPASSIYLDDAAFEVQCSTVADFTSPLWCEP